MQKIIFLDFDGVLNPMRYNSMLFKLRKTLGSQVKTKDEYGDLFAPYCVEALEKIINQTGAVIVISSSWRRQGLERMQTMWKKRKLPGTVVGITNVDDDYSNRQGQIQEYVDNNMVFNYVIIDDIDKIVSSRFVKCNSKLGLTDELADECIEILKQM